MLSRCGIGAMRLLGRLPLPWVRALGCLLGWMLYALAAPRRRVASTNLRLCFPDKSEPQIRTLTRRTVVLAACFQRSAIERLDLRRGFGAQANMRA